MAKKENPVALLDPSGRAITHNEQVTVRERSALDLIAEAARDPSVDVEKFARLMEMQERIIDRERAQAYNVSMMLAQQAMAPVVADRNNTQTRSKYASHAAVDRAIRPIYTRHGFSVTFNNPARNDHGMVIKATVDHIDGHRREYEITMPDDGKGAKGGDVMTKTHASGSAVTYGMRYLLKMIFNLPIVSDDDDGNRAGAKRSTPITEKQAEEIIDLCREAKRSKKDLLNFLNGSSRPRGHAEITEVEDIPAERFNEVVRALKQVIKANSKDGHTGGQDRGL